MATALRVGILGAGRAGAAHAAAYGRLPGVAVVAVWSRTRGRAEALAAPWGRRPRPARRPVAVYDRWEDLLDAAASTRSASRRPGRSATRRSHTPSDAGCTSWSRSPLSVELPEARAIAAVAERAGGHRGVLQLALRAGAAGRLARRPGGGDRPASGRCGRRPASSPARRSSALVRQKPWVARRENGGGMLREAGHPHLRPGALPHGAGVPPGGRPADALGGGAVARPRGGRGPPPTWSSRCWPSWRTGAWRPCR